MAAAPNAFRGSLSAFQAAVCISEGLQRSRLSCEVETLPLADGGDGTLDVMLRGLGGEKLTVTGTGPNGAPLQASVGLMSDGVTAVVEMAQASGVERLTPDERNPLITTSYGTGELIRAAIQRGFRRIIIGLGGSATNDGGAGCMQALGAQLLDAAGQPIRPGGAALMQLEKIDASALKTLTDGIEFVVLCDVDNPLYGPNGASSVFGPQKGADVNAIETLDQALMHYSDVILRDLHADVSLLPGGGAAGGFGAGLVAFLGAALVPGADTLISLLGYETLLEDIDLIITGEGKLDAQTAGGKAVRAMAALGLRYRIPVVALCGALDAKPEDLRQMGIDAAWSIVPGPCELSEATAHASEWLVRAAAELGNTLAIRK